MLTLKPIYQFVLAGLAMMLFLESTPAATMSINPKNGISGTLVTVHGSEFPPNERIDIVWLMPVDPVLSAELVDAADHVPIDDNGSFTTTIVVPKSAPINEEVNISVFISEGSIITGTSFTVIDKEPAECADAYFIGVHGTAEGPDGQNQILSQVIGETWENFYNLVTKSGKTVKGYAIDYPAPLWRAPISAVNAIEGSKALEERVFKESCLTPRIVFTGYSLGAWVINEWIAQISAPAPIFSLLNTIQAVELYGDPLWYRFGPSFPADQPQPYKGLARHAHDISPFIPIPPSYDNDPQGPGGDLSNRWQSRCLKGDPVCGEDYIGLDASGRQLNDIWVSP